MSLFNLLSRKAREHGFPVSGALDLDSVMDGERSEFKKHVDRYDQWLADGREGEMGYLRRGRDRRADPRLVFPGARSIFCVGYPYWRQPIGGSTGPRYARYLKATDYHLEIADCLERLLLEVRVESGLDLRWKVCVDTSAVLERSWAALAGLGWIGKNTTLIHPRLGSYFFIAEALLNEKVDRGPAPIPNYCGNCTRCLRSCPTSAFEDVGVLDSRKCISYWTLERRGDWGLSDLEKKKAGNWVAGCDICQEACPFNFKPSRELSSPESSDDSVLLDHWLELVDETEERYLDRVKNSALNRIKPAQFSRNLAVSLRNSLDTLSQDFASKLTAAVCSRIDRESDPVALSEWRETLRQISAHKDSREPSSPLEMKA